MKAWPWLVAGAILISIVLWQAYPAGGHGVPERMRVHVLRTHPHDREAFTQGLLYHEGHLYESTGQYGASTVRRVDLESGQVLESADLPPSLFGEGIARSGDRLIQVTWRAGKAIVWDASTLEKVTEHDYRGEGWGLCFDGQRLIMSNGSDRLTFRDPETFEKLGEVGVRRAGRRLRLLNELECVDGQVYANVWMEDRIARIDPSTGDVTGWIDASGLLPEGQRDGSEDVLNGIAYLPDRGTFLLTGKNWPLIFEVEFKAAE